MRRSLLLLLQLAAAQQHLKRVPPNELQQLLRGQYMPQFTQHILFSHLLRLLGQYDAESLFPPAALEQAKRDLTLSMEGELTGTRISHDTTA